MHYSDDLLKTPDPNGGKFGDWIVKKDTFNVTCRLCKSNVCIKEGEKALAKHSSSAKHHKAKGAQAGTGNIFQAFAQQDAKQREQKSCEKKARDGELIYLHHIEAHGIPPHVASCTTLLCIYTSHVVCTSAGINDIRITIVCICFNLVLYAVTGLTCILAY